MSLRINDTAPNFTSDTTQGKIDFHAWIENSWAIIFSHPKDFTPVCTTELSQLAKSYNEFEKRNCKVIGLSIDSVAEHKEWIKDIESLSEMKLPFPLIGDENLKVAKLYNMLPADADIEPDIGRTAVDNLTVRCVYLIGPDKKIKMILTYPMSSGRNINEIIRVLDSCQLTANFKVATPANWKPGEEVIIVPSVSNEEARKIFPNGWKTIKSYLRILADPSK